MQTLPDGSRVNVVLPPLALDGPVLTIRRFRPRGFTPGELVALGTLAPPLLDFLGRAVQARCTLLICGGTGSGKTTTLGALAAFVDPAERVVTIEEAAELRLPLPHVVRMEARPPNLEGRGEVTIRRLVRNALRMRPDRLIVGEVRGPEALDLLVALSTGHAGSLCTIHAGSAAEAVRRLETLALMADVGLPLAAIRDQIADALDLVVRQERGADGTRRIVEVAEVVRVAGGPAVRELFTIRAGRPAWRAPLGDTLAARLTAAAPPDPPGAAAPSAQARSPGAAAPPSRAASPASGAAVSPSHAGPPPSGAAPSSRGIVSPSGAGPPPSSAAPSSRGIVSPSGAGPPPSSAAPSSRGIVPPSDGAPENAAAGAPASPATAHVGFLPPLPPR